MKRNTAVTLTILAMIFSGCGTTSYITSSWKAENIEPASYKKIVVLALANEADRTIREKMEQHIAGDLRELGYDAVCSCEEYNPKAFENMTEEQALKKLKATGVDAVLTIVLLDKTKERFYVPGRITYTPYSIYHDRFYGYYRTMYGRVYTPGYYVEDNKFFWESNLYEMTTGNLVYSAQSKSFDPVSSESLGHEYGKMIVSDMLKKKVLQNIKGADKSSKVAALK